MSAKVNIVVALKPEVKPIIGHFGLTLLSNQADFPVYVGESINLIQSGVGKESSALATMHLAHKFQSAKFTAWLNIGIAGNRSLEVGTGVQINKIVDRETSNTWYPSTIVSDLWSNDTVVCVKHPELKYEQNVSYDMESAGFYKTASKISLNELIFCYKVISDNQNHSVKKISKNIVVQLIESHIPNIETLVNILNKRVQSIYNRYRSDQLTKSFFEKWRFSVTQQHQLKNFLNQCAVLGYEITANSSELKDCGNSRQVLQKIRSKLDSFWV